MTRAARPRWSWVVTVAVVGTLAVGCSSQPPAISTSVADDMTRSVVEVAGAAGSGDLAGALETLDSLQRQLDAAIASEDVTPDRGARIQLALDTVRGDIALLTVPAGPTGTDPVSEPVEAEPVTQEPQEPAVEQPLEEPSAPADPPSKETPGRPGEPANPGKGPGAGPHKGEGPPKGKEKNDG